MQIGQARESLVEDYHDFLRGTVFLYLKIEDCTLTRIIVRSAGFIPALSPKRAQAEGACTDFSTAANGIKWCDTKEGSGKTPNKGQLIR